MTEEELERLKAMGLDVETVGTILDPDWGKPVDPVLPPILADQPPFPAPGIYFGMPEDVYHSIHAVSASGLKKLATSNMDYWACSPLNPDKEETESKFLDLGKAYHKRIVEGADAYAASYAVELDQAAFDPKTLLVSSDQIKNAIKEAGHKPTTKGYDDNSRAARKEDWIAQLADIDPSVLIWDKLVADHAAENEGKSFVSAKSNHRIEIAAKMIEAHPELKDAFRGGHAEVAMFWFCPKTGAPMKMRADYLKMRAIVDLKSFSNSVGMPINRAIERAIANMRYNVQHVVYDEGVAVVRDLIRHHGASAVHVNEAGQWIDANRCIEWAFKWAKQTEAPGFMFVFQQTGAAPVTRGRIMPRGTVFSVTKSAVERLKRRWVECAQTFGTDPWIDVEPVDTIEDEAIPLHATEL